jgi:hypothetical protein
MANPDSKTILADVGLERIASMDVALRAAHQFSTQNSDVGHWNDHPVYRTFKAIEQFTDIATQVVTMFDTITVDAARNNCVALRQEFQRKLKLLATVRATMEEAAREQSREINAKPHDEAVGEGENATGVYAENLETTGMFCKLMACGVNYVAGLLNGIAAQMLIVESALGMTVWNEFHSARKGR